MPLKSSPLDEPSINLTSMLDVVMLLIIFFMLSTQFREEERQYEIKLPTVADATALSGQPDELLVNISAIGQMTVRGEVVDLSQLEAVMRLSCQKFAGQGVVIRGDGTGQYQYVMDAMAACRRAGVKNLSLAHRPIEGAN